MTESAALAPARSEMRRMAALVGLSLAVLVVLALAVHRVLLRPVRNLSAAVTRARGERGVHAPHTGPAEIARLAGDLNALLEARDATETRLAELADRLADSGRVLVDAREQERQHLGTQIHDGPIQDMVLASWALDDLARRVPAEAAGDVRRRIDAALAGARLIEADLRPPKLVDSGLSEAVAELVARRRADSPFSIEVDDSLEGARFPLHTELLVYRGVQEALLNARRHSRAANVTVVLAATEGWVTATVTDDGVGVEWDRLAAARPGGHYGLVSMLDTVTLAGGRFSFGARTGGGTEVRVEIPTGTGTGSG